MLRHFLIIKQEGVPLYSFSNKLGDPHIADSHLGSKTQELNSSIIKNSTLFSGLMSSFLSFGKELGGSIRQIRLDNVDLYMYEEEPVIGVTLADPSDNQDDILMYKEMTEFVTQKFVDEYSNDLIMWDGEVSKFDNFHNKVFNSELLYNKVDPGQICESCFNYCCKDFDAQSVSELFVQS